MSDDSLPVRLQLALGESLVLERELGGNGSRRGSVAREPAAVDAPPRPRG